MNCKSLTEEPCFDYHMMWQQGVPDLLVSGDKLDLGGFDVVLLDYNDQQEAGVTIAKAQHPCWSL
jgi:hypothetical protein